MTRDNDIHVTNGGAHPSDIAESGSAREEAGRRLVDGRTERHTLSESLLSRGKAAPVVSGRRIALGGRSLAVGVTALARQSDELEGEAQTYSAGRSIRSLHSAIRARRGTPAPEADGAARPSTTPPGSSRTSAPSVFPDGGERKSPLRRYQERLNLDYSRAVFSSAVMAETPSVAGLAAAPMPAAPASAGGGLAAGIPVALPLATLLGLFLAMLLILSAVTVDDTQDVGSLTGVQAEMARYLLDKGYNKAQTAAIIANAQAESGCNPTSDENMSGLYNYAYERAIGLFQFTDCGASSSSLTSREATDYMAYASAAGRDWTDVDTQLDWFVSTAEGRWMTGFRQIYYDDAYPEYANVDVSYGAFMAETDVAKATFGMMAGYEGPSASVSSAYLNTSGTQPDECAAHFYVRLAVAQEVYAALTASSGSGQELAAASAAQQAIVSSCESTPSPGAGLCAAWVSNVFSNAGAGDFGGNACDMYWQYCTSSDRDSLKVGMIVAVPSAPYTAASVTYGHVAIYVGDGKVMQNVSGNVKVTNLDDWIAEYNESPKWGWLGNKDLS